MQCFENINFSDDDIYIGLKETCKTQVAIFLFKREKVSPA